MQFENTIIYLVGFAGTANISPPQFSFIFTNMFTENNKDDRRWYNQVPRLAKKRNARYFPVRIICNEKTLRERRVTPERSERFKTVNTSDIQALFSHDDVIRIKHPNLLTLDVSDLTPEQSADTILEHVRARYAY